MNPPTEAATSVSYNNRTETKPNFSLQHIRNNRQGPDIATISGIYVRGSSREATDEWDKIVEGAEAAVAA